MKQILLPNTGYPDSFVVQTAVINAQLVLQAYGMFDQWNPKRPGRDQFKWEQPAPPDAGMKYSNPLWAIFRCPESGIPKHPHQKRKVRWRDRLCPIGFIASHQNRIYLVFRGTLTSYEWTHVNLNFLQKKVKKGGSSGNVHRGFLKYYNSVRNDIGEEIKKLNLTNKRFIITGHSLGSALATLAAKEIAENIKPGMSCILHAFASPRVLGPKAIRGFEELSLTAFRIVNVEDIVNGVPLANAGSIDYQHIGTPISFSAHYGSTVENHSMKRYLYAMQNPKKPQAQTNQQ